MTFLGLELNAGFTAALTLSILGVFWNYSSLPELNWETFSAGLMALVAGGALELLYTSLQTWASVAVLEQVVQVLYLLGGLLVLVGALVQAYQLLNQRWM